MEDNKKFIRTVCEALDRIEEALKIDLDLDHLDNIDPRWEDYDPIEHYINPEDEIYLHLPHSDGEALCLTYAELESFSQEVKVVKLVGLTECWTDKRCCVMVEPTGSYESHRKLEEIAKSHFSLTVSELNTKYEVRLKKDVTMFGFAVVKDGSYSDFYPPVNDDLFIEIKWDGEKNEQTIKRIVNSLIFEFASSHGLSLRKTQRYDYELAEEEAYFCDEVVIPKNYRPLLHTEKLSQVLNLYSLAIATDDPEFQIIGYVKVLEHISATVVREDLTKSVRSKLQSSRALDPDSSYILELESIITTHHKQYMKDSEALKLTINKCCDAVELSKISPDYLTLSKLKIDSIAKEQSMALTKLSASISSTRNQIVHAKLNYTKTGDECPTEDLPFLAKLCRVVTEQSIRWYSSQHESNLIT